MPKMTGSRYFAEAIQGYGVTSVFLVPTIMLEALAEMEDLGIRRVTTHGEKAAAYMADGYARAAHRPGICIAQNIGAANLAAGLPDAYMTSSPRSGFGLTQPTGRSPRPTTCARPRERWPRRGGP